MSRETTLSTNTSDRESAPRRERISLIRPIWRSKPLLLSHVMALLLVATWLMPTTRPWWDRFDLAVFRTLNDSLSLGHAWSLFWAVANYRALDLLPALFVLALFVVSIWGRSRNEQNQRWALLGVLGAVLVVVPPLIGLFTKECLHYARPSPTLVFEDTVRLSQLFPSIDAKDASPSCFPGDHAFVLLTVTSFFWYVGRRRDALIASLLAAMFLLPRLVGGAHWASDVLVGSSTAALLAGSWTFATPLCHRLATLLHPLLCVVMSLVPRWLRIPAAPQIPADDAISAGPEAGVVMSLEIDRDEPAPPRRLAG